MVFSSLTFIFSFLPLTILIYYLSPSKLKNFILFVMSLVFYAWGEPIYILVMLFSTVFDYINGRLIDGYKERKNIARMVLVISVVGNLAVLCFFKYYDFLIENVNALLGTNLVSTNLALPIGISFYTFQTMSYTIDVYLGKAKIQKNIIDFGTYVTMFPQLVAGPIVRYKDLAHQLKHRKESLSLFSEGVELFIIGLGKKVLLANNIGMVWTHIQEIPMNELSLVTAWIGIISFTFQIYFDFSGYSDMAMGLGKMFGFSLVKNFDYPYISKNVTEFWRRWHISLGTWFREYVYIPLGGNKKGFKKQCRNLLVVWFLTGLWHGANWNFILWGLYYGAFVMLEKLFLLDFMKKRHVWIQHSYTLLVVVIGWSLFAIENLKTLMIYLKTMFGSAYTFIDQRALYYLYDNRILWIILIICSTPMVKKMVDKWILKYPKTQYLLPFLYIGIGIISTAYLINQTYNPFLYFRF